MVGVDFGGWGDFFVLFCGGCGEQCVVEFVVYGVVFWIDCVCVVEFVIMIGFGEMGICCLLVGCIDQVIWCINWCNFCIYMMECVKVWFVCGVYCDYFIGYLML